MVQGKNYTEVTLAGSLEQSIAGLEEDLGQFERFN